MSTQSATADTQHPGDSQGEALPRRYRFDVDEYYAMARAGIFNEDDRVELLDGDVIEMSPIGRRHRLCVNRLTRCFSRLFADGAAVQVQSSIRLGRHAEPEPDVTLLKLPLERYTDSDPTPDDVLLLVEVADTSLAFDRDKKLPQYARARIAEVWLVNVEDREIEICRKPSASGYAETQRVREGAVSPLAFPDVAIGLEEILGPAK